MKNVLLLSLLLIVLFSTGCQKTPTVSGLYNSTVPKEVVLNKSDTIFITTTFDDDFDSKYYIDYYVEALKQNGFTSVFSYYDKPIWVMPKYFIGIKLSETFKEYKYTSADYGSKYGGSTTNCYMIGNSMNCNSRAKTTHGVVGYSEKTGITQGQFFVINIMEIKTGKKIFSSEISSFEQGCNKYRLYEFLMSESAKRIDLSKPTNEKYSKTLPKNFSCNDSNTYKDTNKTGIDMSNDNFINNSVFKNNQRFTCEISAVHTKDGSITDPKDLKQVDPFFFFIGNDNVLVLNNMFPYKIVSKSDDSRIYYDKKNNFYLTIYNNMLLNVYLDAPDVSPDMTMSFRCKKK